MGRKHSKFFFKLKRKKYEKRKKARLKEKYGEHWNQPHFGEINPYNRASGLGLDILSEDYITLENTKPKRGRIPKNPSESEMPPYLVGYCMKALKELNKTGTYKCVDRCQISDYCKTHEPGNPKIDTAYVGDAFNRLEMISFKI